MIWAQLPDKVKSLNLRFYFQGFIKFLLLKEDPNQTDLYNLVITHMIHGPCGVRNPSAPCMVDGKCSKGYPKQFRETSCFGHDGYAEYARPENGRFFFKDGHKVSIRML